MLLLNGRSNGNFINRCLLNKNFSILCLSGWSQFWETNNASFVLLQNLFKSLLFGDSIEITRSTIMVSIVTHNVLLLFFWSHPFFPIKTSSWFSFSNGSNAQLIRFAFEHVAMRRFNDTSCKWGNQNYTKNNWTNILTFWQKPSYVVSPCS